MALNTALRLLSAIAIIMPSCRSERQNDGRASNSFASLSISPTTVTAAFRTMLPPRFRVFHVFPEHTGVWSVGSHLIACEWSCEFERINGVAPPAWRTGVPPRTWLISSETVEEDACLLLHVGKLALPRRVRYAGHYPDKVFAILAVNYDEKEMDMVFRYLGRGSGNRYVFNGWSMPDGAQPAPECREGCEPFDIYQDEENAAWTKSFGPNRRIAPPPNALLFGHGGPLLAINRDKMALWDGRSWVRSNAPWCSGWFDGAIRLSNGASLVFASDCDAGTKIFWISPSGGIRTVDLAQPNHMPKLGDLHFVTWVERDSEIWLVADADSGDTVLLSPVTAADVMRPPP